MLAVAVLVCVAGRGYLSKCPGGHVKECQAGLSREEVGGHRPVWDKAHSRPGSWSICVGIDLVRVPWGPALTLVPGRAGL